MKNLNAATKTCRMTDGVEKCVKITHRKREIQLCGHFSFFFISTKIVWLQNVIIYFQIRFRSGRYINETFDFYGNTATSDCLHHILFNFNLILVLLFTISLRIVATFNGIAIMYTALTKHRNENNKIQGWYIVNLTNQENFQKN